MAKLFETIEVGGLRLANRIVIAPMCQYSAVDGMAQDWHFIHYGSRAVGGAGLIIVEATAVNAEGRISPGDLGLWQDRQIEPLARIASQMSKQGSVPCIQLAHAGRKASTHRPWIGKHGSLKPQDGGWVPTFPNAQYVFTDPDAQYWDPANRHRFPAKIGEGVNTGFFDDSVKPILERGMAQIAQEMLARGDIAGAGLDVYEHEPAINPKLLKLPNVVLLPHMGSATVEGRIDMGEKVIVNVKTFMDGHRPPDRVIPSML